MAVTFSKFKNFGRTTLAAAIDDDDLSFTVPAGTGDRLPAATAPDSFPLALGSDDGGWEIVTARRAAASDTVTIVARAAEDGSEFPAKSHDAGAGVINAVTGKYIDELQDAVNGMLGGTVVFDAVSLGDDDEVLFGADLDFKARYSATNNRLEVRSAANTVLEFLSAIGDKYILGDLTLAGGDLITAALTASLFNTGVTTLNIGGAATVVNFGAATATFNMGNQIKFAGGGDNIIQAFGGRNLVLRLGSTGGANQLQIRDAGYTLRATISDIGDLTCADIASNGGDFTSTATTYNLLAQPTTVNAFAGASAALNIGHASAKAALLGGLSIPDAKDVAFGTTTGGKLGTSASQKIGIWGVTPVVQPSAIANATRGSSWSDGAAETDFDALLAKFNTLLVAARAVGWIAA